ncbi:MAG: FAD-dependent oxidoreductase [Candidatus Methanomethylophilaceae archaeon]|jgi:thioredoxin reductase (NADPH)|nr:FAD-dependent oxidoreductase [Candidatus Methanomethylophilaceae archaeon]
MINADVLIIGAGPAGLQAAIHAARKKVSVVLVGKPENSALAGAHIENYLGVPGKADGSEILRIGTGQAEGFGCRMLKENVTSAARKDGGFEIVTETDEAVRAKAVILATGISRVKLGVPGEKELFGRGVSYCAACDGNFYKGKVVAIIGGETEAAASAELMTAYASKVYWVAKDIAASENMVRKASAAGAELVRAAAKAIKGDDRVNSLELDNGTVLELDGVFIELGAKSSADLAMDLDVMPEMDDTIKVDASCFTGIEGVYACGDVTGKPWQMAKAVGQGAVAGTAAAEWVRANVGK